MKLREDFVTYDMNGERVLVCASGAFSGIARSNKTAAFILECLKEDTTVEKIVDKMEQKYQGAPREQMLRDVSVIIEKLREINAIDG